MKGWMTLVRGLALVAGCGAVLLAGCGPTLGVRGQLLARAGEEMACPHPSQILQIAEDAFEVDGCERMVEYTDVQEGDGREWERLMPAVTYAVADMLCGLDRLERVRDTTPRRRTFVGCGATATYDLRCVDGIGCRWTRDGEVARQPVAPPPIITPAGTPMITPVSTDVVVPPPPGAP